MKDKSKNKTDDKMQFWGSLIIALIVLLSGCSSDDDGSIGGSGDLEFTYCPTDRASPPVACTQEYNPVCGQQADGTSKFYANSCNACADPKVVGYLKGSCS